MWTATGCEMTESARQNNSRLQGMSDEATARDRFLPPIQALQEVDVDSGMHILDFGCGLGGFSLAAANLVGPEGMVYAVDNHPFSIESVKKAASKQKLTNIRTYFGSTFDDIISESVDFVLLYDVLHDVSHSGDLMSRFHRVLKKSGIISVKDQHLDEDTLVALITSSKLFVLKEHRKNLFQFGDRKSVV